jgi:L-threonylcarbamoyladenylate synthase
MRTTTRVLAVDPENPDPAAVREAGDLLRRGDLVAFATETVYGLGADATNAAAVARIFEAKGRPATNPLIVHVEKPSEARRWVTRWPRTAEILAQGFWPGPLTLVLPRSAEIPPIVTAGRDTVGIRVPACAVAQRVIAAAGRPIAAPSANRSTRLSPTLARHVLKDLDGRIELVLDSGPVTVGLESTVVDLTTDRPAVLRPGAITAEALSAVLGVEVAAGPQSVAAGRSATSPGQLPLHYAPRTATECANIASLSGRRWPERPACLILGATQPFEVERALPGHVLRAFLPAPEDAANRLYAVLHEWDEMGLDLIVIVPPPDEPTWRAIRDRITRATSKRGSSNLA